MEELIDLIATDAAATDISDHIKQLLFVKAADKIEYLKPDVAASMFGETETEDSVEEE
jgi:hypothetical protein